MCIDPDFFDLEIYAIYRAVNEVLGEETWRVVWRAGEILYEEVRERAGVAGLEDPFEVLKRLAEWLKRVGYIEEIEVVKVSGEEIEYIMREPVIARGAKRLIEEGRVPPHISTALMFAALKRLGLRAEMVGTPRFLPDGRVVERWRLVRA